MGIEHAQKISTFSFNRDLISSSVSVLKSVSNIIQFGENFGKKLTTCTLHATLWGFSVSKFILDNQSPDMVPKPFIMLWVCVCVFVYVCV